MGTLRGGQPQNYHFENLILTKLRTIIFKPCDQIESFNVNLTPIMVPSLSRNCASLIQRDALLSSPTENQEQEESFICDLGRAVQGP